VTIKIALKKVDPGDMDFLYELHNDPNIRKYFHQRKKFTYAEHIDYWNYRLNTRSFTAKIIQVGGIPVGCVRREDKLISIAILPSYQNKGIARDVLKRFCKSGDEAEIYFDNATSLRLFNESGFIPRWVRAVKK